MAVFFCTKYALLCYFVPNTYYVVVLYRINTCVLVCTEYGLLLCYFVPSTVLFCTNTHIPKHDVLCTEYILLCYFILNTDYWDVLYRKRTTILYVFICCFVPKTVLFL